ncbi:MAG: hypothetical protein HYV28_18070, partial [Ignavibacteriales bacterium]|nr:hypothetical protein [Ignavibacteriales bacterium]
MIPETGRAVSTKVNEAIKPIPQDIKDNMAVMNYPDCSGVTYSDDTLQNVVNQMLPVVYFANDSIFRPMVTNTINFTADLSEIYGSGSGVFDPNQDSILVMGLDWDNLGTVISGNRRLIEVPSPAKRFKTTMTIRGALGDSTKWKYKAFPG